MSILAEMIKGILEMAVTILLIVIPLMIVIELLSAYGIMKKITDFLKPSLRYFNLSPEAGVPLLIGQFLGLSYSAGVLVQYSKDNKVPQNEMWVVCLSLGLCHSLIEDTMLFVAVGARLWVLVVSRLILFILATYLAGKYIEVRRNRWETV